MIEKNMKSRHVQKHATESEWLKANIFIPKQAEIIVYDVDENHPYERFKIGDGVTLLADLPFSGSSGSGDVDLSEYATKKDIGGYTATYAEEVSSEVPAEIMIKTYDSDLSRIKLGVGPAIYHVSNTGIRLESNSSTPVVSLRVENYGGGYSSLSMHADEEVLSFGHYDAEANQRIFKNLAFTDDIPKIIPLTQSEYDALPTKDETTIYIIKE